MDFRNFISYDVLLDIGFKGDSWTWSNNWEPELDTKGRLDRDYAQ